MRQLTQLELKTVKDALVRKEISSAEILMEVYDHYVSHVESRTEEEFENELLELEQKFTRAYCNALQSNLFKTSKKEIFNLQWSLFKTYFDWPKMVGTILFLTTIIFFWGSIESRTKGLMLIIPLVFVLCLTAWIWYKSHKKVKEIKKLINAQNRIESSYLSTILIQFSLMTSSFNLLILVPKILDVPNFMDSIFFLIATFTLFIFYTGYTLTLFEAWKVKSKTALI
jgi:hypothetical protein